MGQPPVPQADWFTSNAPNQQNAPDWFATNAPQQRTQGPNPEDASFLHQVGQNAGQDLSNIGAGALQGIGGMEFNPVQAALHATNAIASGAPVSSMIPFLGPLIQFAENIGNVKTAPQAQQAAGAFAGQTGMALAPEIAARTPEAVGTALRGTGNVAEFGSKIAKNPVVGTAVGALAGYEKGGPIGGIIGAGLGSVAASRVGRALSNIGDYLKDLGDRTSGRTTNEKLSPPWKAEEGAVEGTPRTSTPTPGGKSQVPTAANTNEPQLAPRQDMSNTARTRRIVAGLPPDVPAKTAQTIAEDPDLIPLLKQSIANRLKDLM